MKLRGYIPEQTIRYHQRDTVALVFEYGSTEFHVRGSVCWPVMVSGQYLGCVLVGGLDVVKNRVAILAEHTFASVGLMLDPDDPGTVLSFGVGQWFNAVWNTYYCHRFFVEAGATGQHDRYKLEVRVNPDIQPQPRFKLLDAETNYAPVIEQYLQTKRLIYKPGSAVELFVRQSHTAGPDQPTTHPVGRALGTLLNGFLKYPWRKDDQPHAHNSY